MVISEHPRRQANECLRLATASEDQLTAARLIAIAERHAREAGRSSDPTDVPSLSECAFYRANAAACLARAERDDGAILAGTWIRMARSWLELIPQPVQSSGEGF